MSSCENAPSNEVGISHQNGVVVPESLSGCGESPKEVEGDEEEDEDFNPFAKGTPSQEASSSLSSDIEGLDADVVDSKGRNHVAGGCNLSSKMTGKGKDCAVGGSQHGEGDNVVDEKDCGEIVSSKPESGNSGLILLENDDAGCERDNGSTSGHDINLDVSERVVESNNTTVSSKSVVGLDSNDAICMRTRARYSLASFTLDELETFLQESDDDDDIQNVDEQEEYRKFLASVLQGRDGNNETEQEREIVDDEDEDNDADFQIEIEEALESDIDEETRTDPTKERSEAAARRPETRQKKRQKAASQNHKKLSVQVNRPLRPILPLVTSAPIASFPALEGNFFISEHVPHYQSSTSCDGLSNGFTPHQIGQLYCLIHEHVQLLIQIFSLCALEPSKEFIASQVQELILELLHKRDQEVAWRSMPYPSFCFRPPYLHPSVPDELPKISSSKFTFEAHPTSCSQQGCSSVNDKMPPHVSASPFTVSYEHISNGQASPFQTTEGTYWVPCIGDRVLSVLDVAPLSLVERYMDDISTAKREHQKCHLEGIRAIREPLFPLHNLPSLFQANSEAVRGPISPAASSGPSSSPSYQPPKKTLAASLVESTKKHSVAPVPREIVKFAWKFLPLFNPALYPYTPPPAPLAKRVLFTDSEDELLALGLIEYNTDWKAIQQRFLPCKSKHQIFVRQKNRSSSKAPENPIKAVRRLKTSPLTGEEIARIQEGLKIFKLDWRSIWKFIVPYRDPSMLPRQWRIALGTQKSYKSDTAKKEKRRLNEFRKRCEAAASQTASEREDNLNENAVGGTNSGDDCEVNEDEAYVHEAFLADWRPSSHSHINSQPFLSGFKERSQCSSFSFPERPHIKGASYAMDSNLPISHLTSKSSKSLFRFPHQLCSNNNAKLVKLAPGLPPVNLPPSVRVISQSAFKSYQRGSSTAISAASGSSAIAGTENMAPGLSYGAESGNGHSRNTENIIKYDVAKLHPQKSEVEKRCAGEEDGNESDLQMHPLLFQTPEGGYMSSYTMNSGSGTAFSFSHDQPQLSLSLFRNSQPENPRNRCSRKPSEMKMSTPMSGGIDFHPLLRKTDNLYDASPTGDITSQFSVGLESIRENYNHTENSFNCAVGPPANGALFTASNKSNSPDGKPNEVDLDIHLSSTTCRKEKAAGGNAAGYKQNRSSGSASGSRNSVGMLNSSCQDAVTFSAASAMNRISGELIAGACAIPTPSSSISAYTLDNVSDQSLPGIVMEQEELSDSDEEIGEDVEFEREEMADSDGEEGSEGEQVANIQDKEALNDGKDAVAMDASKDHERDEPIIHDDNSSKASIPQKGSISQLASAGQAKDTSNALLLSLKTSSSDWHSFEPSKHVEGGNETAGKIGALSHSKRSCKKITGKRQKLAMEKHAMGVPPHPDIVSVAATPVRKPMKRAWISVERSSGLRDNEIG